MASDGEIKATSASAKKRVGMNVQDKKSEAPLKSNASDGAAAASGDHSEAEFTEGMVVNVRSADNAKRMQRATVVRVHRSGELSVKYERSGEVEKYVALSRIQRTTSSSNNSADEDASAIVAFTEGDAVLYRLRTDSDDDTARSWRKGTVKTCRRDGAYDIVDTASGDVVKKVAPSAMKRGKAGKTRKDNDSASASDGDASDDKRLLVADARVEYKDKRSGAWHIARIHRVRSDGTVDLAVKTNDGDGDGSDGGDGETIVKRVARSSIRKPSKRTKEPTASKRKDASDDDSDDTSVRKRRSLSKAAAFTKRSQRERRASGDSASESESDARVPSRRNKTPVIRNRTAHMPVRVNQVVEFADKTGRLHRGRVKLVRKDDDACDIAHMSDSEIVSKRVPLDSVRAVSAFARFMGRPAWMQPTDPRVFQLNARVLYRTRDGVERKAVVVKVYRD